MDKELLSVKVSIITVCFNSEKKIDRCIKSVAIQEKISCEHIIIDGGSLDGTISIIEKNRSSISNFISEEDDGIYDAMNKGAALATGDFLYFLNSDDQLYDSQVLFRIFGNKEKHCYDLLFCDVDMMNPISGAIARRYHPSKWYRAWMLRLGIAPPHPGLFIASDYFKKIGGYDKKFQICGDFDLICRSIYSGAKYNIICVTAAKMDLGGVSTSSIKSLLVSTLELRKSLKNNKKFFGYLVILRFFVKFYFRKSH